MENNDEFRAQEFLISEDGYMNLRVKVTTEDKIEREKVVASLMGNLRKGIKFDLNENIKIDKIYFKNQDPTTTLKLLKSQLIEEVNSIFDELTPKY